MPRAADLGIRIGALPTGPTDSVARRPRRRPGPRHRVARRGGPARGPRRRPHRRDGHRPAAATPSGARALRRGGAQRRRRVTGFIAARRVGAARDADPADLDHAARPGLRRGLRALLEEEAADRRRTSSSRSSASATTPGSTTPRRMQVTRGRRARPRGRRPRTRVGVAPSRRPRAPSASGTGMSCLGFKGGIGTASRRDARRSHGRRRCS